jgi:hypothetical protein
MTAEEFEELRYLVHWYKQQCARADFVERKLSSCTGKDSFETRNQADKTISPRLAKFAHVYQCTICHRYHIGSRRAGRGIRINRMMEKREES